MRNIYIYIYICMYGMHHWRIFRSSYRKLVWVGFEPMTTLNSVRRSKRLSYHTVSSTRSQSQPCAATPISSLCSEFIFHFGLCLRQLPQVNSRIVITLAAEWIDAYGIHHWRIFRSSYRKLAWVGFEPMTTEFRSDALTDCPITPWVQLALRANSVQLLLYTNTSYRTVQGAI